MEGKGESQSSSSLAAQEKNYFVPLSIPEQYGEHRMITFPGTTSPEKEYTGVHAITSDHPANWGLTEQLDVDAFDTELAGETKALNYAKNGDTTPWTEYTGRGSVTSVQPASLGPLAWFREVDSYLMIMRY